jgi:hypothetical protein
MLEVESPAASLGRVFSSGILLEWDGMGGGAVFMQCDSISLPPSPLSFVIDCPRP